MPVLLAPSADLAREVQATVVVALTVEAEYGSFVAEGALYTAAHHQPAGTKYAGRHLVPGGRPSPCNDVDIPVLFDKEAVVLVSHVDLDTFGGCLRANPKFRDLFPAEGLVQTHAGPPTWWSLRDFWDFAEYVDTQGAHKITTSSASPATIRQLYAFWAWSKSPEGGPKLPRDQVTDVTDLVAAAGEALRRILGGDEVLLAAGDAFREDERALNERTFVRREGDVLVRSPASFRDFCNHLYTDPSGVPARAVVSYNRDVGSVTISLADPVSGVSCRTIVQDLWGPEAGGHMGIAGSPRERNVGEEGREAAVRALLAALA
jgi:hypothetical protein